MAQAALVQCWSKPKFDGESTAVAPVKEKARRICREIEVVGKEEDLLNLFRIGVFPNDEGTISSLSNT